MDKELVSKFLGLKVKLTVFVDGSYLFYHGYIKEVSDDGIIFIDRFSNTLAFSLDTIKKIEVMNE